MDATEVWQTPASDDAIRNELRKYQARYLTIVNRQFSFRSRNFQIGGAVIITIGAFFFGYSSPYRPYSFIPALALVVFTWNSFFSYEKLRKRIDSDVDQQHTLDYFRRKLDIVTQISYIQKLAILNSTLVFLNIWMMRPHDQLFDEKSISLCVMILVIVIIGGIFQRWKVYPVINFLSRLVSNIETKNTEETN